MKDPTVFRRNFALAIIIILFIVISIAFWRYMQGFFGAIILYILFRPLYAWMVKKKVRPSLAASLIIVLTLLIIILPSLFLVSLLVGEVRVVIDNVDEYIQYIERLDLFLENINLDRLVSEQIQDLAKYFQSFILATFHSILSGIISLIIMYYLLFYLLIKGNKLGNLICGVIPFSIKNSKKLIKQFKNVTHATLLSTGIIAIIQGGFLGIGFFILGVQGAFLWGFIGVILSFIPFVGITLIWVPAGLILIAQGNVFTGVAILILGAFLSTIDNFIRPILQKRFGRIHPLVSVVGVFIGLPLFGILGLILGPLLISYFFVMLKMFREEYLIDEDLSCRLTKKA